MFETRYSGAGEMAEQLRAQLPWQKTQGFLPSTAGWLQFQGLCCPLLASDGHQGCHPHTSTPLQVSETTPFILPSHSTPWSHRNKCQKELPLPGGCAPSSLHPEP